MIQQLTNVISHFRHSVRGMDSPSQLAGGIALGMMIGMVPKDSLFVLVLFFILLCSRANLLTATCSAVLFTLLSPLLVPITHSIGWFVLTCGPLQSLWCGLIELPIIPWTRFDNTVVMGGLIYALIAAYPLFRFSEKMLIAYQPQAMSWFRKSAPAIWLLGPISKQANQDLNRGQA